MLGGLQAETAIKILVGTWSEVPESLINRTEREYNEGIKASRPRGPGNDLQLAEQLQEGQLAARFSNLVTEVQSRGEDAAIAARCVHEVDLQIRGHFYYIAAGIGSGIAEIQQVCLYTV
jgi:hypothetical protein